MVVLVQNIFSFRETQRYMEPAEEDLLRRACIPNS